MCRAVSISGEQLSSDARSSDGPCVVASYCQNAAQGICLPREVRPYTKGNSRSPDALATRAIPKYLIGDLIEENCTTKTKISLTIKRF
ncbi:hypothetical protein PoB_001495900 [Plakobranchus ocellatus]|uniref:Uncharacterized protein n=1 Tax=Plakobranchus ocellatus TaxID=259542 RepID=A0AAV3YZI7_9GAST|nr:hypothetical protein PoB_001495900 [Plakobranchus ocellatus]